MLLFLGGKIWDLCFEIIFFSSLFWNREGRVYGRIWDISKGFGYWFLIGVFFDVVLGFIIGFGFFSS